MLDLILVSELSKEPLSAHSQTFGVLDMASDLKDKVRG